MNKIEKYLKMKIAAGYEIVLHSGGHKVVMPQWSSHSGGYSVAVTQWL